MRQIWITLIANTLFYPVIRWIYEVITRIAEKSVEIVLESVKQWLEGIVVGCKELVHVYDNAIRNGLGWGLKILPELKDRIIQKWNESEPSTIIVELATAKLTVKVGTKIATNSWEQVAKGVFKTAINTGVNNIGIIADIGQTGLELAGYKKEGMIVGATGNAAAGATVGLVGGPVGALVGGAAGLTFWGVGELFGALF